MIVKRSCIHRLQLGFVKNKIPPIRFSYFTALNVVYLHISVRDVVVLKCCSKWVANEFDFVNSLVDIGDRKNDCQLSFCKSTDYYLYK